MSTRQLDASRVSIGEAKGRPLLSWVGKRPLRHVAALPAQEAERYALEGPLDPDVAWDEWPMNYPRGGLLFHGDNKEVLGHLLGNGFRGKVDLVYIDPPFDSGADYVRRVQLRGVRGTARLAGEGHSLGEQLQYTDIWANDNYLQFMYERLLLIRELMAPTGSLFLHCDWHRSHLLRCVMDEVFGSDSFVNEVIWRRADAHNDPARFGMIHDSIFYYGPKDRTWTSPTTPLTSAKLETDAHYVWDAARGQYFRLGDLRGPGDRGPKYAYKGVTRNWKWSRDRLEEADRRGELYFTKNGIPFYKLWIENEDMPLQDLWMDIPQIKSGEEKTDYPTQKPEALLERIITSASEPGHLVLDCFLGSGTTAVVAQRHGRRWIGADINKGAIHTSTKGLVDEMARQAQEVRGRQATLDGSEAQLPAQLSFGTYRVNDYDLAIQQNEAVELACQALGVERLKTDGFFDGTLGRQLVRILPFNHPASPLDVDEVIAELRNRPTEDRDVVIVALGKELASEARLAEHNRPGAPNRITLIELRTDPKLAGFFSHETASADVRLEEADGVLLVVIKDFISPTILERLRQHDGLVSPQITDWRAMVDSVMIDPSYDGAVFEVGVADMPERKTDFVAGSYSLPADAVGEAIAVKVTDMLGEEVLSVLDRPGPR